MDYQQEAIDFHAEHGGESTITYGSIVHYPDGAMRMDHPGGICIPPPADSYNRWKNIADFHRLWLQYQEFQFNQLQAAIKGSLELAGLLNTLDKLQADPKYQRDKAELEELKQAVLARRELLRQAEAEIEQQRPSPIEGI